MATKKQSPKKRTATPLVQEPPALQGAETTVAELAHRLFLERGGAHGHDVEDWLEAERLLRNGHV